MKYPYTNEPWEVDSGMVQTVATHDGRHIPICLMDRTPGNGTVPCERDSNAHLIACAPELFELAKLIRGYFEESGTQVIAIHGTVGHTILSKARTIINRVEKQTE